MDNVFEFIMDYLITPLSIILVLICFLGIFILIPYYFLVECKKPTFSLIKHEWSCSKEYEYTTTTMIMIGKVMTPQIMTHHECIQWSKK